MPRPDSIEQLLARLDAAENSTRRAIAFCRIQSLDGQTHAIVEGVGSGVWTARATLWRPRTEPHMGHLHDVPLPNTDGPTSINDTVHHHSIPEATADEAGMHSHPIVYEVGDYGLLLTASGGARLFIGGIGLAP